MVRTFNLKIKVMTNLEKAQNIFNSFKSKNYTSELKADTAIQLAQKEANEVGVGVEFKKLIIQELLK
tara:strand:- start:9 stop:209 length:201 start_codon:yes stop_codon:yes gene_type:complete